eukprot:1291304-Karenia_brevis.AAC.1
MAEGLQGMLSTMPRSTNIKTIKPKRNCELMTTTEGGAAMGQSLAKCPKTEDFDILDIGLTARGLQ